MEDLARPRSGALGIARWVLPAALLPVAPPALLALAMPRFFAPLRDVWPLTGAVVAVLVLANLAAGRASSAMVPAISIIVTTSVAILLAVLGPAAVLIVAKAAVLIVAKMA